MSRSNMLRRVIYLGATVEVYFMYQSRQFLRCITETKLINSSQNVECKLRIDPDKVIKGAKSERYSVKFLSSLVKNPEKEGFKSKAVVVLILRQQTFVDIGN